MKVLVTTIPAWGHLVPMLGTLRALERAGHEVLVATSSAFHPSLASLGLRGFSAGLNEPDMLAECRARWPSTEHRPPREWALRMFTEIAAPAMATDLAPLIEQGWPDLILSEEGEYGGRLAGDSRGVAVVTHGWGTPPVQQPPGLNAVAHIDPCPPSMARGASGPAGWRLRFEVPRLVAPSAATTSWIRERRRPLAYVGFGTVPLYRDRADVPQVMAALDAAGLDALCTVRDPTDPAVATAVGSGGRLEKFVSLPDLLPSCAIVVTHGGAGTTMGALAHGVPVLVIPQGAPSQHRMADACTARGVGRGLAPEDATATRLRADIQALLEQPGYAAESTSVAEEIGTGPDPSTVVDALATLATRPPHQPKNPHNDSRSAPTS